MAALNTLLSFAEQVETVRLLLDAGEPIPEALQDAYEFVDEGGSVTYKNGKLVLVALADTFTANSQLHGWPVGVTLAAVAIYQDITSAWNDATYVGNMNGELVPA